MLAGGSLGTAGLSVFGLPVALWALPDSTQPVALIGTAGPQPRRRRLRPVPQPVSIHTEVGTLVSPATPCRARSGASATTVAQLALRSAPPYHPAFPVAP